MNGVLVLVVVLVLATAVGLLLRRNEGRMRTVAPVHGAPQPVDGDGPADVHVATRGEHGGERMSSAELGVELGSVATFVQFSGPFCSSCPPTRRLLGELADQYEGVVHVDIDSEQRMDLVRRYGIMRTPTVLVLDADGRIVKRGVGVPRRVDLIAALGDLVDPNI